MNITLLNKVLEKVGHIKKVEFEGLLAIRFNYGIYRYRVTELISYGFENTYMVERVSKEFLFSDTQAFKIEQKLLK